MFRLTGFELGKIWGRRSFFVGICVLLLINGFLLWYTNLTDGERPPPVRLPGFSGGNLWDDRGGEKGRMSLNLRKPWTVCALWSRR